MEQAEAGAMKTVAKGLQIKRLQFSEAGQAGTDDVEKDSVEPVRPTTTAPKPCFGSWTYVGGDYDRWYGGQGAGFGQSEEESARTAR